ncbi:hypothetical protein AVEN_62976-1 [Araneus ventricosus]|uniref:Uncharacterized protein n=1 Tax=Araneus ventricosus TaxID=182803 RepID=A0A4Y2QX16_ARAVE|nr:hypothetical protein AVEN_62976-1 [Araneus ventricosus]
MRFEIRHDDTKVFMTPDPGFATVVQGVRQGGNCENWLVYWQLEWPAFVDAIALESVSSSIVIDPFRLLSGERCLKVKKWTTCNWPD